MDRLLLIEFLLRGAAAGLAGLLGLLWLVREKSWAARAGAAFCFGSAAYALVSSPSSLALFGPGLLVPLAALAIFNGAFFWWFALSLFDDAFRPRPWMAAPFIAFALTIPVRLLDAGAAGVLAVMAAHTIILISLMAHAMLMALRDLREDLVEPRRKFRVAVATLIPVAGIAVAGGEIAVQGAAVAAGETGVLARNDVPDILLLLHAALIFGLAAAFAIWALAPRRGLLPPLAREISPNASLSAADQIELDRIRALMAEGLWKEEGLTVGALAARAGLPEHRARRLINQGMGRRNFSDFLASYRIEAARKRLADPAEARTQVLTIALDTGYASLGPFNRAFKARTGMTPTEYRRQALADSGKAAPNP